MWNEKLGWDTLRCPWSSYNMDFVYLNNLIKSQQVVLREIDISAQVASTIIDQGG